MGILQNIKDLRRLEKILQVLFKYRFGYLFKGSAYEKKFSGVTEKEITRENEVAIRIRKILEELGGTFVKLGQVLSLRPDLVGYEVAEELRKLQDNVPSFNTLIAKEIIERELKTKIQSAFSWFEEIPLASASIGQVHRARLKSGEEVVIKVQRPNIREIMMTDIDILKHLAQMLESHSDLKRFDLNGIVDEFEKYTLKELDYKTEGRNITEFYNNFKNDAAVRIPKVFWNLTTTEVLTMEYLKGTKLGEALKTKKKFNNKVIADRLARFFLRQVIDYGFFHADPHPGNLMIMENSTIGLIDFGICGRLTHQLKIQTTQIFISVIKKDIDLLIDNLFSIGVINEEVNKESVKADVDETFSSYYNTTLQQVDISTLFKELISFSQKYRIKLPRNFVLLAKSVVTLEGVGRQIDPEFNLIVISDPFIKEILKKEGMGDVLNAYFGDFFRLKTVFQNLPFRIDKTLEKLSEGSVSLKVDSKGLQELGNKIDLSGVRRAYGIVIASFLVISTLLYLEDRNVLAYLGYFFTIILLLKFFRI